jgi:hypothetical protein
MITTARSNLAGATFQLSVRMLVSGLAATSGGNSADPEAENAVVSRFEAGRDRNTTVCTFLLKPTN